MTAATTAICSLPKTLPEEQAVTSAVPQLGGRKVGKNPWNCSLECAVHDWEGAGEGENPGFAACPVGAAFCLPGCSEHSLLCLPDGENKQQKKAPSSMRFHKIPGDSWRFLVQQLLWISAVHAVPPWHRVGTGEQEEPLMPAGGSGVGTTGIPENSQREADGIRGAVGFVDIQVVPQLR